MRGTGRRWCIIIAGLIALVDGAEMLPRPLHRFVCRVLRPAESALAAADRHRRGRSCAKRPKQPKRARRTNVHCRIFHSFARGQNRAAFALIDPRKSFGEVRTRVSHVDTGKHALPQISVPGLTDRIQWATSDERLQAKTLSRRIEKLDHALKSLPRQARRLNRLMTRRAKAEPGPGRVGPIRPGHPPGYRRQPAPSGR